MYHHNHLHYFHHCIAELDKILKHLASTDIDFSENLTVPFKYEPQSLYCYHQQAPMHSQISKTNDNKNDHAHFSDDHLQMLTNEKERQVLRVWSVAGHGKGEVGYISGMTKISIKIAVSNDCFFDKSFKIY